MRAQWEEHYTLVLSPTEGLRQGRSVSPMVFRWVAGGRLLGRSQAGANKPRWWTTRYWRAIALRLLGGRHLVVRKFDS